MIFKIKLVPVLALRKITYKTTKKVALATK